MIPEIDITRLQHPDTMAALHQACIEWGLFQVTGHGLDPDLCTRLLSQSADFFALDAAAKQRCERSRDNPWGYYDRELTKNVRDWKQIFDIGATNDPAAVPWPASLDGFQSAMRDYYAACTTLANALLGAIASNLGTNPASLQQGFAQHSSFLRLNYYPTCGLPAAADSPTVPTQGNLGIGHHTDAGALTVLLQDAQPGLQVRHEQQWHTVRAQTGALVINIGDIAQVWSNDRYQAPVHRVLANSERRRYSAAFFYNPSYRYDYAPLVVADSERPRYRSINWGEFRRGRSDGDFANYGSELQISDYRL